MTSGCILVLDTATAAVRASVSVPGYDPDDLAASLDAPDSPFLNRALESYAVVQCSSRCWPRQRWSRASAGVRMHRCCGGGWTDLPLRRRCSARNGGHDCGSGKSCNGYFIRLGQELGPERVREMAVRLGFGRALNLADTLSTAAGQLPEAETLTSSGAFANFCFGQGELLATPIQIAAMMNTMLRAVSGGSHSFWNALWMKRPVNR